MTDTTPLVAQAQLQALVERIERASEEREAAAHDVRDIYAEAKGAGFSVKALRAVVRLRKKPASERHEEAQLLELYLTALGMLPGGAT